MTEIMNRFAYRVIFVIAMALLLSITGASDLMAQRFEGVYGGVGCREAARAGTREVREGGYIAAGETFATDANCSSSDIYVVRTDNLGNLVWSMRYDIGVNDSALDIEEVVIDPTGGFIITGVTDNSGGLCPASRDIFLLRIDRCGEVLWVQTYGEANLDEVGYNVEEATTGSLANGTRKGDFIVAGWKGSGANRDGYLMRVTKFGVCIWGNRYRGPGNLDDYFYGLYEAISGVPDERAGDIIACGGTTSYIAASNQAWIVRVDGNDGTFNGGGSQGGAAYGDHGFEEFRSVIEIQSGANLGEIVAIGTTSSTSPNLEVYLAHVSSNLCTIIAARTLGDAGDNPDEGFDLAEIRVTAQAQTRIITTGYVTPPLGQGHGLADVFLQDYTLSPLAPVAPVTRVYGSGRPEWGWSVGIVGGTAGCALSGYIVGGFTLSGLDPASDLQQLYLIKTDRGRRSGCETIYAASDKVANFPLECTDPTIIASCMSCTPNVTKVCETWGFVRCLIDDGIGICAPASCPSCVVQKRSIDPGSNEMIDLTAGGIAIYPNPVKRGSTFNLRYMQKHEGTATLIISDILGKVIHAETFESPRGEGMASVSTEGWTVGVYVINVSTGDASYTQRIMVGE